MPPMLVTPFHLVLNGLLIECTRSEIDAFPIFFTEMAYLCTTKTKFYSVKKRFFNPWVFNRAVMEHSPNLRTIPVFLPGVSKLR